MSKHEELQKYLSGPASPEDTARAASPAAVAPVRDAGKLKPVGLGPRRRLRGRELEVELTRRGASPDLARLAARRGLDAIWRDSEAGAVAGAAPALPLTVREHLYNLGVNLDALD
jgi:hypothetical protein